jgi:hypothetical protein
MQNIMKCPVFEGKRFLYMDYSAVDNIHSRYIQWVMVQLRE